MVAAPAEQGRDEAADEPAATPVPAVVPAAVVPAAQAARAVVTTAEHPCETAPVVAAGRQPPPVMTHPRRPFAVAPVHRLQVTRACP